MQECNKPNWDKNSTDSTDASQSIPLSLDDPLTPAQSDNAPAGENKSPTAEQDFWSRSIISEAPSSKPVFTDVQSVLAYYADRSDQVPLLEHIDYGEDDPEEPLPKKKARRKRRPLRPSARLREKPPKQPHVKAGKWGKPLLFCTLGFLSACCLICLIFLLLPFLPAKEPDQTTVATTQSAQVQDMQTINGCPELFDLKFGTSLQDALAAIRIDGIAGYAFPISEKQAVITLPQDAAFSLWGLPVRDFQCQFANNSLHCVYLYFPRDQVTYSQLTAAFVAAYGPAAEEDAFRTLWQGEHTILTILTQAQDNSWVVRYLENNSHRFPNLAFHGPAVDPCGFLDENKPFGKTIGYLISGLKTNMEYKKETFPTLGPPSFITYTIYPTFEYMGIPHGSNTISFVVDASENTISTCCYHFSANWETAADTLERIKAALAYEYGEPNSCKYTNVFSYDPSIQSFRYQDVLSWIRNNKQGQYLLIWELDNYRITLQLQLETSGMSCTGYVAFTSKHPTP